MKKMLLSGLMILLSLSTFGQERDYTSEKMSMYRSQATITPRFVPLEVGEIRPEGWLRDWAEFAAKGVTGHLDEYEDVFRLAWKGVPIKAPGVGPEGTGWPLEQCSYWLDGAVKLAYILNDSALIQKTSERLDRVVNGVLGGADNFIYWKPDAINTEFNVWAHSLMGRSLVSYYQATHDPKILKALDKVYSGLTLRLPDEHQSESVSQSMEHMRASTNVDAMSETYVMTGDTAILRHLKEFGNNQSMTISEKTWLESDPQKPVSEDQSVHGVTYYEAIKVPAIASMWSGDKNGMTAAGHILKWGEKLNLLPFGVCSSEEYLAGKGAFRNTETCNVPTSMWSLSWLLRLSGTSTWADKIEQIFFNAGPAPVTRDFKMLCYYQSPNRLDAGKLPTNPHISGPAGLVFTPYGAPTLCCAGNVNNTIPDYIQNMCMESMDGGLAFTLYGPCRIEKSMKGRKLSIQCRTEYPFDDKISILVGSDGAISMPVYLRIPNWCSHYSVKVNGKAVKGKPEAGFVEIFRTWKNRDRIDLVFPMKVKVTVGKETPYPNVKYFASTKQASDRTVRNPFECVTYGPLLYALPIRDINANKKDPEAKYNYALDIPSGIAKTGIKIVKTPMKNKIWDWGLEAAPVKLIVRAKEFNWNPTEMQPLPEKSVKGAQTVSLQLVPYGCTKFRVSMFPVTERAWMNSDNE